MRIVALEVVGAALVGALLARHDTELKHIVDGMCVPPLRERRVRRRMIPRAGRVLLRQNHKERRRA